MGIINSTETTALWLVISSHTVKIKGLKTAHIQILPQHFLPNGLTPLSLHFGGCKVGWEGGVET